ncbi:MAG: aldehyde dehydrogenase [Clostridiales bacterium]|nr:aldehyde dehydrogenase [Clostridiales bacterium]
METKEVVALQRSYFLSNQTKKLAFRKDMLNRLYSVIKKNENEILLALHKDLGKSRTEGYMTEVSILYGEIRNARKNLEHWARPKRVPGTLATFPAANYIYKEPYGVTLILAPWNYPFNLSMAPLVGAISAGNTALIKCSKSSIHTAKLIQKLINENFPAKYLYCVDPEADYDDVISRKYDYIFFTGSPGVGKTIMRAASEHLTPVSLELGGKSPCFVDRHANLRVAAKRIVWGKFLNAGQTCISIDYVLVDEAVREGLIGYLKQEINKKYANAQDMEGYPNIINRHHFERLKGLIERAGEVWGGASNEAAKKIAPAIIPHASFDQEIMEEEIFGPILPIIGYTDLEQTIATVKERNKPLACYIFTERKAYADKINAEVSFGGGCVNDVIMHVSNHHMPFGGVGNSGMGGYHGKYSFDTFSHTKSVVKNITAVDIPLRYPPFDEAKLSFLKKFI